MKKLVVIMILLSVFPGVWQACIDDESVGYVRELSIINIESEEDMFYANFGEELTIEADISQTGEGNISYEWAWGELGSDGSVRDSLRVISTEPVLHYAFRKLGQFKVRLKATNEDGSSFCYFVVYVRAAYEKGLLVLSKDEKNLGRTSFLRVKEPGEIVTGNEEEFVLHACEGVNPGIELDDPRDIMITGGSNSAMMILSDGGSVIYRYDKKSFEYLNSILVDKDIPGLRLEKICGNNSGASYGWGQDGYTWVIDYLMGIVMPDDSFSPEEKFDKLYYHANGNNVFFVNFEESYINHAKGNMWPSSRFTSEDHFKGRYIVNLMGDVSDQLNEITTDSQDAQSVTITTYTTLNGSGGLPWAPVWTGGFRNPKDTTYHADKPLTLTRETEMLTNGDFRVTLYTRGNELYQWIYSGKTLPDTPLLALDGEITCMALSPNKKHVYLGIWNPSAKEELKGSIYILDMKTSQIVKQYRGVADKPMKIMYKD